MFTNKTNLIVFAVIIAVVALICTSVVAFISIEDAKKENESANLKIEELKSSLNSLQSELVDTNKEISEQDKHIQKYQEILSAWSKATPNVNEAIKKIAIAYEDVASNAHLFPKDKIAGLEDDMMDAIYSVIRSTEPLSLAKDFENNIEDLSKSRYDNIMKAKIEAIKQNGVTFPEDRDEILSLRDYYNGFLEDAAVTDSLNAQGLNNDLAILEAALDTDEENDLALIFEKEVEAIKTPILPGTSLEKAIEALGALTKALEPDDEFSESTEEARQLLALYIERATQLIRLTDAIRLEINRIHTADPNVTYEEIATLDAMVDELLTLDVTIEVINTEDLNYVMLLKETRLLPYKNDAFKEVKAAYDMYYTMANDVREILISLVEIKDATFNAIENAQSIDEINSIVEKAKIDFAKCLE